VQERYRYDAYGKQTITTATGTVRNQSAVGFSRGFTGYILDDETGLYYARARMYSAGLGRFNGRDSMGYINGFNLSCAYFVPLKMDPSGMVAGDVTPGPPLYGSPGYSIEILIEALDPPIQKSIQMFVSTTTTWFGVTTKCEFKSGSEGITDVLNGFTGDIFFDTSTSKFDGDWCLIVEAKTKTIGVKSAHAAMRPPLVNIPVPVVDARAIIADMDPAWIKVLKFNYIYADHSKCKCCPFDFGKLEKLEIK